MKQLLSRAWLAVTLALLAACAAPPVQAYKQP